MKTNIFLILLGFTALPAFGTNDPKAVQILQKAAELHGLASKSLASYQLDVVYSGVSGGFEGPSRWHLKVDFGKHLDLGQRYVYDAYNRGMAYQRRIDGDHGRFMFGMGTPATYDLGTYFDGNAVLEVANIALLAVRNDLENLMYVGTVELGGYTLDQVDFTYHGAGGTAYFSQDGRYAGHLEVDLKDNINIYEVVTAYQKFDGLLVPSRFTLFDDAQEAGGFGKLVTFRANPVFAPENFAMKPSKPDPRGRTTPFGFGLVPSDKAEFVGLKVSPRELSDTAKALGLAGGDEIVAVNGKDVRQADFFDLEALFWSEKSLEIAVLKGGQRQQIKLVR